MQSVLPFIEALCDPTNQTLSSTATDAPTENPLTPQVVQRIRDRLSWARVVCESDWPPKGIAPIPSAPLATDSGDASPLSWCDWAIRFRGPLLLVPSSLAFITLALRAKANR